jgi:AcrR family transcriptional regulator
VQTDALHPGRRERNKLANRASILAAAREAFFELGFDACTIRDIIRRSGLAAGTFYNYFTDKESVFRELIEIRVREVTSRMTMVRKNARSLHDFVLGSYRVVFEEISNDPFVFRLVLRNENVIRSLYTESVMGISVRALKLDMRDAIRRGILPEIDVDLLSAAFFGAGYEMGRVFAEQPERDPEAAAQFTARLFLGGIQAFNDKGCVKPLKLRVRSRPSLPAG